MQLLKDDRAPDRINIQLPDFDLLNASGRVRCPQCGWVPTDASRWSCVWAGTPEARFASCGTVWNTFSTRGRCPGCSHQWQWTSCLQCEQWSPHDDWYEEMLSDD